VQAYIGFTLTGAGLLTWSHGALTLPALSAWLPRLSGRLTVVLAVVEMFVGCLLLSGVRPGLSADAAALLLGAFAGYKAFRVVRYRERALCARTGTPRNVTRADLVAVVIQFSLVGWLSLVVNRGSRPSSRTFDRPRT
jgi:hypothetical protein